MCNLFYLLFWYSAVDDFTTGMCCVVVLGTFLNDDPYLAGLPNLLNVLMINTIYHVIILSTLIWQDVK